MTCIIQLIFFSSLPFFSLLALASGLTFVASLLLLGFTYANPLIGMFLFSLSLALGPVGLVSSVPVILPLSLVGTGMGLIKSGTNIGASLFDIATGFLQDAAENQGYGHVIDFFIGIGVLAVIAGLTLCVLDWTMYGSLLDRSAQEAKRLEALENKLETSAVQEKLWDKWLSGGIYIFLAALSWVMFFKFVLVY